MLKADKLCSRHTYQEKCMNLRVFFFIILPKNTHEICLPWNKIILGYSFRFNTWHIHSTSFKFRVSVSDFVVDEAILLPSLMPDMCSKKNLSIAAECSKDSQLPLISISLRVRIRSHICGIVVCILPILELVLWSPIIFLKNKAHHSRQTSCGCLNWPPNLTKSHQILRIHSNE